MNNFSENAGRRAAPGSLQQMKRAIDQLHQAAGSGAMPNRKLQLLMRAMRRGRPGQQPDALLSAGSVQGMQPPPPLVQHDTLS